MTPIVIDKIKHLNHGGNKMGHDKSCCGHEGHHPQSHHGHPHGHGDCCGGGSWRRFVSKAEKKQKLEHYRKELEAELAAVNELLEEI